MTLARSAVPAPGVLEDARANGAPGVLSGPDHLDLGDGESEGPGRPLQWRRLRQFLYVFERRNIARAASELYVTEPAISKALRLLEQDLQVPLFERNSVGVVPTRYGYALAVHARAVEAELREAQRRIEQLRGAVRSHLRIGVEWGAGPDWTSIGDLRRLQDRANVRLTLHEGSAAELTGGLLAAKLDLVIAVAPVAQPPEIVVEEAYRDRLEIFASPGHPLCGQAVTLEAMAAYPWVLPPVGDSCRQRLDAWRAALGAAPQAAQVDTNSWSLLLGLLAGNEFLTVLPRRSARREARTGLVRSLTVPGLCIEAPVTFSYRRGTKMLARCQGILDRMKTFGDDAGRKAGREP